MSLPAGTEGVPAEIRTGYLLNRDKERSRHHNRLGACGVLSRRSAATVTHLSMETGKSGEAATCPSVRQQGYSIRGQVDLPLQDVQIKYGTPFLIFRARWSNGGG
jgi:hypothetical protein